jgi:hypothetical protein
MSVAVAWEKVAANVGIVGGIDAGQLRRIRRGNIEPRAARTFEIGEALHAEKVLGCSGALALWRSTHIAEFVDFVSALAADAPRLAAELVVVIDALSPIGPLPRAQAVLLAVLYGLGDPRPLDAAMMTETTARLKACYDAERYASAWKRATNTKTAAMTRRVAPFELQAARPFAVARDRARVLELLVAWVMRCEPAVVDDEMLYRHAARLAIAQLSWVRPDRAERAARIMQMHEQIVQYRLRPGPECHCAADGVSAR